MVALSSFQTNTHDPMKTILLIEDNPDIRENTAEILTLSHYNVRTAENGETGVKLAFEILPDLILCDITMPVLDGFGVFMELNKNIATAGIPFIFLTAKSQTGDVQKGFNLGADDYIVKPFDDKILLSIIEARIKKNEIIKDQLRRERSSYMTELENMLHITSHRVRKPICTFLGLMQLLELKAELSSDEVKKLLQELKANAVELDDFTKELTIFLHDAREKSRNKNWS